MRNRVDQRRFEAWLDGLLEGDEKAEFELRLEEDEELQEELSLHRSVEEALLRSFPVPRSPLAHLSAQELASLEEPLPRVPWRLTLQRAAAAVVLIAGGALVSTLWHERPATVHEQAAGGRPAFDPISAADYAAEPAGCDLLEPLRPDLESLYASIIELPVPQGTCSDQEEAGSDGLARLLASRYGTEFRLTPGADRSLFGPHSSEEWPSGMVLSGYPDGPEALPVVLIAEDDSYHSCCVHAAASPESGLQVYTWRVGDVLLTELSPHDEPRFLESFRVAP